MRDTRPLKTTVPALLVAGVIALAAARADADHERFLVGEMRNVDPSADTLTSVSGACVPSHDRERLDCYFTAFALWKPQTEEPLKKQYEEAAQELARDPAKTIQELRKGFCSDKRMTELDPIRLKYSAWARAFHASVKAFCERPTRESALAFFRTMGEADAKKCRCVVSDWRSTLARQADRWVENSGPSGLCGVIKLLTLVPHDLKRMKEPTGPVLWTLHEKTVTTHGADDKLCAKSPFRITDGAVTLRWDAPQRGIECEEFEFTSALEGMSDPRKR